jgi:hypothetical protein
MNYELRIMNYELPAAEDWLSKQVPAGLGIRDA